MTPGTAKSCRTPLTRASLPEKDAIGSHDDLSNKIITELWNNAAKLWKLSKYLVRETRNWPN